MKQNRNIRCMILRTTAIIWGRMSRLEIYPAMYAQTFFEGMKKRAGEYCQSAALCMGRKPEIRSTGMVRDIHSSFESLQNQFAAGLNMGIAGIPWWTTDIGGFSEQTSTMRTSMRC
ncbi:MAG: TIM-barrel domain-containing protein [Blautia marasmi]